MSLCKRCQGFFTDHEQRKVMGIGILYILGFPILILMIVVGSINAQEPGGENPNCPAEPNLPWYLIIGGVGISIILILRIAINKCCKCVKNTFCDEVMGCFCEFGCNLMYDIMSMILIVLWLITVTWWVMRHRVADHLYEAFGEANVDNFRASLGDNDTIHDIQFSDSELPSYCNAVLYEVAFVLLSVGWFLLVAALVVVLVGKIVYNILCCRLCLNLEVHGSHEELETSDVEFIAGPKGKYKTLDDVQ